MTKALPHAFVLLLLFTSPALAGDWLSWGNDESAEDCDPPAGTRQIEKHGKLWPPFPRPTGKSQPFWHKYHHTHYWPHPYVQEDRETIQTVFAQQAANGWADATTIHDYHFHPETHELNTAGRGLIYWIVTSAPAKHRTVYVAQGMSPEVDAVRFARAQQLTNELAPGGGVQVVSRLQLPESRPATEINKLRLLEMQSMPTPRLLMTVGVGTGAQGAGSSGGATGATANPAGASGGSGSTPR